MIVIADDITGAAEIAGIAYEQGEDVQLMCSSSAGCRIKATDKTAVIATDTRSMSESEAVATTKRQVSSIFIPPLTTFLFFKKTDSALRGHVVAELTALMEATGYQRAVYMPANPSKGRIIRKGTYYISGKPIHKTEFSYDPEYPAHTSSLKERFPEAEAAGIIMPDAESLGDIRQIIKTYNDGTTLFAGAADLFSELLKTTKAPGDVRPSRHVTIAGGTTVVLCGSTQSKPLHIGIPVAPMPREVYDGSTDLSLWDTTAYDEQHRLILTMPYTHRTGHEAAAHLRTMMAEMGKQLVDRQRPDHLIIEGGATAWATLQKLGWTEFEIVNQVAPGVVQMKSVTTGTVVTLKPGSYPWGSMFSG